MRYRTLRQIEFSQPPSGDGEIAKTLLSVARVVVSRNVILDFAKAGVPESEVLRFLDEGAIVATD